MKYIMCAKTFPAYHPRAGEPTRFRESILSGNKIHTIRKTAGGRKSGDMVSLREWSGAPYRSKQIEFAQSMIRVEPIRLYGPDMSMGEIERIACADGLDTLDFLRWFVPGDKGPIDFTGVCIWFIRAVTTGRSAK